MYRQRRRSRFTVTLSRTRADAIEKVVVLAYSPEGAEKSVAWMGTVLHVERGDYRSAEQRSNTNSQEGWRFNRAAIAEAFEAMTGTPLPTNLVLVADARGSRTLGWFNFQKGAPTIKVRSTLSPEQANRTLWHELAHLAQFTRYATPDEWRKAWNNVRAARYGYSNRPWEREAREWEVLAETDFLLTTNTTERG